MSLVSRVLTVILSNTMLGLYMTVPLSKARLAKVANWLDESPTKKVIVAASAVIAVVLSLINGGWTIWKEYQALKQVPRINLVSWASHSLSAAVTVPQVIGVTQEYGKGAPRVLLPYFPVVLELSNPTSQRTSFSNCVLTVGFHDRKEIYRSDGALTQHAIKSGALEGHPILPVESGETRRVELLFFFLAPPEVEAVLNDKATQTNRINVACYDEGGQQIESR